MRSEPRRARIAGSIFAPTISSSHVTGCGHQWTFTAADRTSGKGWEQTFEFDCRWLLRSAATGRWTNLPGQTDSSAFPILGGTTECAASAASNGADVKEYSVSGLESTEGAGPRKTVDVQPSTVSSPPSLDSSSARRSSRWRCRRATSSGDQSSMPVTSSQALM